MEHVTAACALRAFAADLVVSNEQDWIHQINQLIGSYVARVLHRGLAHVIIVSLFCLKLHAASVHWSRCNASKSSSVFALALSRRGVLEHALHPSCCLGTTCSSNISTSAVVDLAALSAVGRSDAWRCGK